MNEVMIKMNNSNKNFKSEPAKEILISTEEYSFFMRSLPVKEKLGIGSKKNLFLKRDQADENLNRNIIGKGVLLESYHELDVKVGKKQPSTKSLHFFPKTFLPYNSRLLQLDITNRKAYRPYHTRC